MKRQNLIPALVVVSLALVVPYIIAFFAGGSKHVFIGFLNNPIDGATYLAKMYEGRLGSWQFYLPYTENPGKGAYILLYYLFLGHLAGWLHLSLILTYHLARIVGSGLLLYTIIRFYDIIFARQPELYKIALWLTALGSGLGWLIVLSGVLPSDFWVAEAYPFLAMFTNPHFPLGLALLVGSFTLLLEDHAKWRLLRLTIYGLLIAVVLPFALAVVLLVAGVWLGWNMIEKRQFPWQPVCCMGILGGPYLLYQFWIINTQPALAAWNAQNLTQSPAAWDFLLSFSPAIILSGFGIYRLVKEQDTRHDPITPVLLAWFGLSLVLIYFPFPLQRRFMLGFYIPVAVLAVYGIDFIQNRLPQTSRWLGPLTLGLSLPTNILLIIMAMMGIFTHVPTLYLSQDEANAFDWIAANTPANAVILSSPQMGLLIPAETGRRVLYGHPFETVNASQEEARVRAFYQTNGKPGVVMFQNRGVGYVMVGPRENALGGKLDLSSYPVAFNSDTLKIYQVRDFP